MKQSAVDNPESTVICATGRAGHVGNRLGAMDRLLMIPIRGEHDAGHRLALANPLLLSMFHPKTS
jgi:hypothetical protein